MPSFKSVIDFILLSYIHVLYDMDLPFIAGIKEYDEITFMSKIMRNCGAYFVDNRNLNKEQYQIILEELLALMMKKRLTLEYHI